MSEYSFGSFDPDETSDLGETGEQNQQGPKWFREGLSKLSSQVNELKAENDRLKAETKQKAVAEALKAKGYAPQAAGLYQGDPDKLDEWLTANNAALARLPEGQQQGEQQQTQQGPPATTVPAEGQEQLQRMQEQGTQGVAPPQGSDKEQAAALAAINDPKAFAEYMAANGNPFDWS